MHKFHDTSWVYLENRDDMKCQGIGLYVTEKHGCYCTLLQGQK